MSNGAKKSNNNKGLIITLCVLIGLIVVVGGMLAAVLLGGSRNTTAKNTEESLSSSLSSEPEEEEESSSAPTVTALSRPKLVGATPQKYNASLVPSVQEITVAADFSNVTNKDLFYFNDEVKNALIQNGFVVTNDWNYEFFERYESNRYSQIANFVTVDSMMHTYHLYFQYLMKNLERTTLSSQLSSLSTLLLEEATTQYEALKSTEWEEAAYKNLAFFAVGATLQNPDLALPEAVASLAQQELALILEAQQLVQSPLTDIYEDYTQYKPRGYYEGDATLEAYFRAMMWYGRLNFKQKEEVLDRCAFLMTYALMSNHEAQKTWEAIYTVTSFFAGTSDDSGYYEYAPLVTAAYGENLILQNIIGDAESWTTFHTLTGQLEPPAINSVPMPDTHGEVDNRAENLGFRLMGQRFTLDEAIFQNLTYSLVDEKSPEDRRMLPDTLDVMAAFGSQEALSILEAQGDTSYPQYTEQMELLRQEVQEASEDQWSSSLYASWLNTLRPLLSVKGEGYPAFMQTKAWTRKDLETFAGSFTELKHDTVLYAKQMMAEMGGAGDDKVYDDRGYVEPEPEVFSRLSVLTQDTRDGLKGYGMLSAADEENLTRLASLAEQLMVIAEKELTGELPTEEEFELIRTYGGTLEHFWQDVYKDEPSSYSYLTTKEFPAALVVDIATDPNGYVLEVGTGKPSQIYVLVTVDGSLKVASGTVYSFYQFEQPMTNRLTDSEWRAMLGIELAEDGTYHYDTTPDQPAWTSEYRR